MKPSALKKWLSESALPTWASYGIDEESGSFFELLNHDLTPVERARRARLTARQIYCFASGLEAGWDGDGKALAEMGLEFLSRHLIREDATIRCSVDSSGLPVDDGMDLYDDAFVLFALATMVEVFGRNAGIEKLARSIAEAMVLRAGRPDGAFQDSKGIILANPVMHMTEAFLAWVEAVPGDNGFWLNLTDRLIKCALDHMIQAEIDALPEVFDDQWQPVQDEKGLLIEPGHQFEWAWLLARWSMIVDRRDVFDAAMRIAQTGEKFGIDASRKIAINAIDEKMKPRDENAKLWPQAERAKFWHAIMLHPFSSAGQRSVAEQARDHALDGMSQFLLEAPPGLWREVLLSDGTFVEEPARASSLYHVACAIITVNRGYVTSGL